jgi:hypothetical protein
MVHAFSPFGFSLIHHHSEVHLRRGQIRKPILTQRTSTQRSWLRRKRISARPSVM